MISTPIRSIGELAEAVRDLKRETQVRWWFRGHASIGWELRPGIHRGYSAQQEQSMSQEFRVRAGLRHVRVPPYSDYAGWLSLMQHYGLPTRLLDWSRSPLIAAFFATEPAMPHASPGGVGEACIWALAPIVLNESQGYEPFLYPLSGQTPRDLLRPAFLGPRSHEVIVAAMPIESDMRMVTQRGAFTIHAGTACLDQVGGAETWLRRLVIPEDAVPRIAEELDHLGVGLSDLFPDLGNLARELKAQHRPAS